VRASAAAAAAAAREVATRRRWSGAPSRRAKRQGALLSPVTQSRAHTILDHRNNARIAAPDSSIAKEPSLPSRKKPTTDLL
jgi:hypothetical protein